jgi:diaminopimelate decarboxylase
MSQDYAPPTISDDLGRPTAHAAADRNYFSRGVRALALPEIDQVPVSDLVSEFGSPLFVFSEKSLREKAHRMREAFTSRYADTSFAWSYKTNNLNAIFQIFREEGWIAEVVSDFEYQKVRKLGVPGAEIVFNGPHKPRDILEQAVDEGALIQIDNWDELGLVEEIVAEAGKPIDVGIRIWLDAGISPIWSKFGFALANGEAERAAVRIVNNPHLRLHTLHTHMGTYILDPTAYRTATQKLLALRDRLHIEHGHLVDCLNLGGGFPSNSLLHGMPGPATETVPTIEVFADAITEVLNDLPENRRPRLRLESGRYLVDEAGYLVTKVVAVKGVNRPVTADTDLSARTRKEQLILSEDAKVGYVIDAGVNLLYTAAWFQIDATPARQIEAPVMPSRLFGPLCMAIDVIRDHIDLPPLEIGDLLTLHPVGAYNFAQSMQFITYRPAVVLISDNGKRELIRVRETLDDVDRAERLPAHLSAT